MLLSAFGRIFPLSFPFLSFLSSLCSISLFLYLSRIPPFLYQRFFFLPSPPATSVFSWSASRGHRKSLRRLDVLAVTSLQFEISDCQPCSAVSRRLSKPNLSSRVAAATSLFASDPSPHLTPSLLPWRLLPFPWVCRMGHQRNTDLATPVWATKHVFITAVAVAVVVLANYPLLSYPLLPSYPLL